LQKPKCAKDKKKRQEAVTSKTLNLREPKKKREKRPKKERKGNQGKKKKQHQISSMNQVPGSRPTVLSMETCASLIVLRIECAQST
jgi:hypothetical protein